MRLIARFAIEHAKHFEIVTVYEEKTKRIEVPKEKPAIQTLSFEHPSAIWFERKMQDDFGIIIEDAFDRRPLNHHERFPKEIHPMLKAFGEKEITPSAYTPYNYETIGGESVFEVSVGPIHAGIIEPGHFHFSQAGEGMLHQEVRHFYKYRGIEKMLEGKSWLDARSIIERISGNESVAYQLCWRDILLEATQTTIDETLRKRHAFLLEMERLAHHFTDLGFIPNDAGFGAALAFGSKLAEDVRRKLKTLTNHRFGFGAIGFEGAFWDVASLSEWIEKLQKDVDFFEDWILDIPSLWDRLDTTGKLPLKKAVKYDTVGVVARSCGVSVDRRLSPFYLQNGFELQTQTSGDVAARFKLRLAEVKNSLQMMQSFLVEDVATSEAGQMQDGEYESFCESSIGELYMYAKIQNGLIERFFVRDPSFINWQALHLMMRRDIIADFPLINKSCDLSYAGNDL